MNIANFRSCYVFRDFARAVPIILGGCRVYFSDHRSSGCSDQGLKWHGLRPYTMEGKYTTQNATEQQRIFWNACLWRYGAQHD